MKQKKNVKGEIKERTKKMGGGVIRTRISTVSQTVNYARDKHFSDSC